MLNIYLQGFLLQASLILALGAQNIFGQILAYVKKTLSLSPPYHLCDAVLIFVGALGFASFFIKFPILKISVGFVGVIFLFIYGLLKLKEAKSNLVTKPNPESAKTIKKSILMTLGFSLLNPHVYLDTIVLIGGYSAKFSDFSERIYFAAGASSFSTFWFFGLIFAASYGSKVLNTPKSMQKVSFISGLILIILSIKLGVDVLAWLKEI